VQEALAFLRSSGAVEERGGYLVTTVSPDDLRLPAHVTEAISSRLSEVSEDDRRLLTIAAFLGDSFDYEVLAAASGMPEEQLLDVLDGAIRQRFLLNDGTGFRFAHPLIRHVLYAETSLPRRHRLHKQIAGGLQQLYSDHLDEHVAEIAHHLMNSGSQAEPGEVLGLCRLAGERAISVYAWSEAARYFEAAVAAASTSDALPPQELAQLHYLAGFAYYRDLDIGPSLQHYAIAVDRFKQTDDTAGLGRALIDQANCRITQASVAFGALAEPATDLEDLINDLDDDNLELRAHALAQLSQVYWTARDQSRAEQTALEAVKISEDLQNDRLLVESITSVGLAQIQSLRLREALTSYSRALRHARADGEPWLQGWPLARIPLLHSWLGELPEAERMVSEGYEVMRRSQDWAELSLSMAAQISVDVIRGDFAQAERHAHDAMVYVERSRYPWGAAMFLPALASGRALIGDWEEADDALQLLETPGRIFDEPGAAVKAIIWLYRQLLFAQRDGATLAQTSPAIQRTLHAASLDVASVAAFCAGIEIAALSGGIDVRRAEETLFVALRNEMVFSSGWIFLVPRVLGLAAFAEKRWDHAEQRFAAAQAAADSLGARPELGRVKLDRAVSLLGRAQRGDRDLAARLIEDAGATFQELKMAPWVSKAAALAERLQTSLPDASPAAGPAFPDRLSTREVEVLQLVARGRSNQQIADELVLSAKTVARHMSNIFDKTGVSNRSGATAYAFEKRLVN
jgi:DNA-binding NarL/FixJ family response regulator